MNDFELSYMYHARSRELMEQAEHARRAQAARKDAKGERREGLAARVGRALHRKGGSSSETARRFQLAK